MPEVKSASVKQSPRVTNRDIDQRTRFFWRTKLPVNGAKHQNPSAKSVKRHRHQNPRKVRLRTAPRDKTSTSTQATAMNIYSSSSRFADEVRTAFPERKDSQEWKPTAVGFCRSFQKARGGPNVKLRCRCVCPLAGNVAAALPGRRPDLQCR